MIKDESLVNSVLNWLQSIVIAENFCPFAKYPFEHNQIAYRVFRSESTNSIEQLLIASVSEVIECCKELDQKEELETTLLIMNDCWSSFDDFLLLIDAADSFIDELNYRGVYQLAHFHPDYQFAGVDESDAQNFTNRAPAPIIHIIREKSISRALSSFGDADSIPERNIQHATKKGADYFKAKLKKIMF